ncbi:cytochrome c oxidase assembly protein [Falsirhodobacter deserti]|uniref:cytochrome c oxidase assembly protein n=1 Tax=Falsirhodobacter deserti TaxID=1365611 RepID=UPI001F4E2928|nr:cytochrome c oxidase assembly protein [Falsirhodobacter deserti]
MDPVVIGGLILALALTGRTAGSRTAWLAGLAVLAITFISPICALASSLFSVRVLHHVLIVAVAAPLLVLGLRMRSQDGTLAFLTHLGVIWLWHMPAPYQAALDSVPIYWVMELSLLLSAIWLWSAILAPGNVGRAITLSLGTLVQMGLLGALLTFANHPLFAAHLATTAPFGLSPLEDQQLAGLLMWVPAAIPYVGLALHRLCVDLLFREHPA